MLPKLTSWTVSVLLFVAIPSQAQRWMSQLTNKDAQDLSFYDYQRAFENYYRQNPVDLRLDKIKPTFRFEGIKEEKDRVDIEEYKMFKRWEWFTEPRVYPTGRWDFQKMEDEKTRVPRLDDEMILRQMQINPLKVRVDLGKIYFPFVIWKLVGPSDAVGGTNMGRVNCIEFDPSNTKTVYIGSPGGGIWKTTDFGTTWTPKFDKQPTLSTGDIAIDPANTKTIYVATSDAFGYGSPFWGGTYSVGIMKSMDAGNTWAMTGLSWTVGQNRTIRRLVISPTNPKVLLAATSNGLYRTEDAGIIWKQIWATSTYDVEFQHNNGKIVYATTSQVFKSIDAGISFNPLLNAANCPGTRYNIEVSKSNPKVLYTLCTNGTVQKSNDAGATWAPVTAPGVTLYGYYDNVLAVSPVSDKIVYVAGFNIKKTTDGGMTWSAVPTAGHVDNHCIEFLPVSSPVSGSATIFCGNDGGLFKTTNSGATWSSLNKGLAITQFYRLGISKTVPGITICGAQDNGNMKSNAGVFTNITNADGMEDFVDWSNANTIYCSIQYGGLYRSFGGPFTNISTPSSGAWITPWCQDPKVAKTIYAGTDSVYKSLNQGTNWKAISPILAGIGRFTTLKVANSDPKWIYAGNGNKLYRTTNGGTTWTDITAGLPVASNYITYVTCSDKTPKMAYVTFSGYNAGQKVYKTTDGGLTWSNISGSLPNMPVNCIVYENNIKNALYIGTDAGVYYRNDGLADWVPYKFGLPNVIVDELEIHYGKKIIRAATYGRGLWQAPLKSL